MSAESRSASVPKVAADYFDRVRREQGRSEHPVIELVFWPDRGWRRHPLRKRISLNEARRLRREGAAAVALRSGGRLADFQIQELTK